MRGLHSGQKHQRREKQAQHLSAAEQLSHGAIGALLEDDDESAARKEDASAPAAEAVAADSERPGGAGEAAAADEAAAAGEEQAEEGGVAAGEAAGEEAEEASLQCSAPMVTVQRGKPASVSADEEVPEPCYFRPCNILESLLGIALSALQACVELLMRLPRACLVPLPYCFPGPMPFDVKPFQRRESPCKATAWIAGGVPGLRRAERVCGPGQLRRGRACGRRRLGRD